MSHEHWPSKNCGLEIVRGIRSNCEVLDVTAFLPMGSVMVGFKLIPNGGDVAVPISMDANGTITHYAVFNALTGEYGEASIMIEWDEHGEPAIMRRETPESWRWTAPRHAPSNPGPVAPSTESLDRIGAACAELLR